MSPRNEDFLFAQESQRRGYVTEAQIEEGLLLQRRMMEELQLDERLAVILVKRGWIAEEQAKRVYARIKPEGGREEIEGYRLLERLGVGAMGTVYKAIHVGLNRIVAIKILRRDLARDSIQTERLKEEAKLLASLDHPNIVQALDAGETTGFPYFVMEYVEGETLKDRIAHQGPMNEIEALRIARGIADALERARRMGIVHRDVKPGNIILSTKGEPKLMDLGLAKGPVDLGLTQHGATVGTPQYISPEQAQDPRRADTRSDIYSLGATLHALVTGRPPFHGTTLAEVLTKVLYEIPTPPRVLNKQISAEVSYLIERMMLKDPVLRYRTPADVVAAIDSVLAGRSIIPAGFTGNWEAWLLRRRLRRWMKVGTTLGVVALALGITIPMYLDSKKRKEARADAGVVVQRTEEQAALETDDDLASVRQKLVEARTTLEYYGALEPEGLDALRSRIHVLEREIDYFEEAERIWTDSKQLLVSHRYQTVLRRFEGLASRIPGTHRPSERLVRNRIGDVRSGSQTEVERLRSAFKAAPARSLVHLKQQHETYVEVLQAEFCESQDVVDAREMAARALETIGDLLAEVEAAEDAFSPAALRDLLERLELGQVKRDLVLRSQETAATSQRVWSKLDAEGWLAWALIKPHVDVRLRALESAVGDLVRARWVSARDEARRLHREGKGDPAMDLLGQFAAAARAGGYPRLQAEALLERDRMREIYDNEVAQATAVLGAIREDVLRHLREGNPEAIEQRVAEALRSMPEAWPFRAKVEGMRRAGEVLDLLYAEALDGLVRRRRVLRVRMRDGSEEARWELVDVHPRERAVTVIPRRGAPRERRALVTVDPRQCLEWTSRDGETPAPILRAVANLATLPETEPANLRPLVLLLRDAESAFAAAGESAGLQEWTVLRRLDVEGLQDARESRARAYVAYGKHHHSQKEFEDAYHWLSFFDDPKSELRLTSAYEKEKGVIAALQERIRKEIKNERLAKHLPGVRIALQGERTVVSLDFETPAQLEVFRRGDGRAWGAREQYEARAPVTPSGGTHRFHLLRQMRGLVRDRPMTLPCVFDPAETIEFEFDYHALTSPFLLILDIDGLQVGVLSADPTSNAYRELWRFPPDVPPITKGERPPSIDWYGRGRGVAFHAGKSFGDPRGWNWPAAGYGRRSEDWLRTPPDDGILFAFRPGETYRIRCVRERDRLTLFVDGVEIASRQKAAWAEIGRTSDRDNRIRYGTGLIQVLSWTSAAVDNIRLVGHVLERWQ